MSNNQQAFLDMLAHSEIGPALLAVSDNGYNVIVGSTASNPVLFASYDDHPHRLVRLNDHLSSTAAGRYQLLARYYDAYKEQLGLADFSPASQDRIALQQIAECRALPLIDAGRFEDAVARVAHLWASLPGAGYGQNENKLGALRDAYLAAGGVIA